MSTPESTILGLRAQIFENWRYMYPDHAGVVIFTTREHKGPHTGKHRYRFEAIIAEDRSKGGKVFVTASSLGTHEAVLRLLLDTTSDLMKEVLKDKPVQFLAVRHLY